jgi:hypothetical protein
MPTAPDDRAGLCARCVHARVIVSSRAAAFYLCRLSDTDPQFRQYPVLPVRSCPGYELKTDDRM